VRVTILIFTGKKIVGSNREIIVAIFSVARRQLLQQICEIPYQTGLVLVDENTCCRMQGLDGDQSVAYRRLAHSIVNLFRQIDELKTALSVELE